MASSGKRVRTLKVKCATWDHVEAFYDGKVKPGGRLPMRVPFVIDEETPLTVALQLPSNLTLSIEGVVEMAEPAPDGKRSSIVVVLRGFEGTMRERLAALVADARASSSSEMRFPSDVEHDDEPPPSEPADVPLDELIEPPPPIDEGSAARVEDPAERAVFTELERELARLREGAAHEVLGVSWDATVEQIRRAYFGLTKRFHPDVFARYQSDAVHQLAQEIFIHVNRGYDRMRDAAVVAGAGIVAGPALLPHHGWLADWDDLGEESRTPKPSPLPRAPTEPPVRPSPPAPSAPPVAAAPVAAAPVVAALSEPSGFFDDLPEMVAPPPPAARPPEVELPDPPAAAPTRAPMTAEVSSAGKPATPAEPQAAPAATPAAPLDPSRRGPSEDENIAEARALLADGKHDLAREMLAKALRAAPRNRSMRALYHVAAGRRLMAHDDAVRAVAQLEAALAHDKDCLEAKASLAELQGDAPKKGGLFKRLFK